VKQSRLFFIQNYHTMKPKILLFCLALLFLFSCASKTYLIGMDEQTFLKENHNAELVQAQERGTIYRITKDPRFSSHPGTKFYYFIDQKLKIIDEGVRRSDVTIDVNNH
jgi:hypothetical protein